MKVHSPLKIHEILTAWNKIRRLWKEWLNSGDKDKYLQAKRKAKCIYTTRKNVQEAKFGEPNLAKILKAMINRIKSLKKLVG